ncbi:Uma2 family endonuclease [Sorangium sp. So ce429]
MQHAAPARRLRHVRAPSPLHFPEEALVPETKRHLEIRTLLYTVLKTFAERAAIGSDQFVYWSASDPSRCLAPDAFVRLGTPDTSFGSWKTWERGAPELAVEIVSEHDADARTWADKLGKYHELGVLELVAFDPDAAPGERLRVWDRIDGDLVERVVEGERSPCTVLELHWVVVPAAGQPAALRLARTLDGAELVLTPEEAERRSAEAARRSAEAARRSAEAERRRAEAEQAARATAERRIAELEAELRRRGG